MKGGLMKIIGKFSLLRLIFLFVLFLGLQPLHNLHGWAYAIKHNEAWRFKHLTDSEALTALCTSLCIAGLLALEALWRLVKRVAVFDGEAQEPAVAKPLSAATVAGKQ